MRTGHSLILITIVFFCMLVAPVAAKDITVSSGITLQATEENRTVVYKEVVSDLSDATAELADGSYRSSWGMADVLQIIYCGDYCSRSVGCPARDDRYELFPGVPVMPTRKSPDRFVVRIPEQTSRRLEERGDVWKTADGRVVGISRAVNRALEDYLGRL